MFFIHKTHNFAADIKFKQKYKSFFMKKLFLSFAILFALSTTFKSCGGASPFGGAPLVNPLTGFWTCVGVSTNAAGIAGTPPMGAEIFQFFSIHYAGVGNAGVFARVGTDVANINDIAALLGENFDRSAWMNFLQAGTFQVIPVTSTTGTVVHTAGGQSISFGYRLENNGQRLIIQEVIASAGPAANSALGILNSIFGTNVNANITIEYIYERMSPADIARFFPNRSN